MNLRLWADENTPLDVLRPETSDDHNLHFDVNFAVSQPITPIPARHRLRLRPRSARPRPMDTISPGLAAEIARRRTFAIIAHPDAGKTTLTEKLLLFGGAIQLAGEVKARGDRRRARSDWMAVEQERGISVSSAVMTFESDGLTYNLLDTPGHQDFSEDTYRTLTAVDSAIMVLDAAKGIEAQTKKLFEVCRLRDVPIITFVNKLDRESLEKLGRPTIPLHEVARRFRAFVTRD